MKIFGKDDKINFVDNNNVFVGFDNSQCCCENFGYFLSRNEPNKETVAEYEYKNEKLDVEGYQFDTSFHETLPDYDSDSGGYAIFRLVNANEEEIFLTIYNHHNGYYSHGFSMLNGSHEVFSGGI